MASLHVIDCSLTERYLVNDIANPYELVERYAEAMIRRQAAFLETERTEALEAGAESSILVLDAALRSLPASRMAILAALSGATFGVERERPVLTFDGVGSEEALVSPTPPHLTAKDYLAAAARLHRSLFAAAWKTSKAGVPFETALDHAFQEFRSDTAGLEKVDKKLQTATYDTHETAAAFMLMCWFIMNSNINLKINN